MEFADLIKISRIDNVRLRRPGRPSTEVTLAITSHHLILSNTDQTCPTDHREIWLLHRGIHSVTRDNESSRSGTITVRYKDFRVLHLDIIGPEQMQALLSTLTSLSHEDSVTSSYPFFYSPGFKALEDGWCLFRPEEEYAKLINRCQEGGWRISRVNQEFSLCGSYGRLLVVPANLTDQQIINAARHRVGGRLPVPSHFHQTQNGTVCLARGSYTVAGWRNGDDEKLLLGIRGNARKGFIICIHHDKSKNGGKDYDSLYPQWKRVNLNLPSVNQLRESLTQLSSACNDPSSEKWLSRLASARWLTYVKDILDAGCLVAQLMEKEEAPVVVLEQETGDLSLVLVSLAQLILNPDTRTTHGLEALIEREWIQGGHPFWSRHGALYNNNNNNSSISNGSCKETEVGPVFLLFLDATFQIYSQFPCSFEFTHKILVLLADHSCSSSFGTFLCNSEKERQANCVREHTVSLWSYLNQVEILTVQLNSLYSPNKSIIWPSVASVSLTLWASYFLRWVQDQGTQTYERRKIAEIIQRNKHAKLQAVKLRKELMELETEALALGLISDDTSHQDEECRRQEAEDGNGGVGMVIEDDQEEDWCHSTVAASR